jgi:hypothetical protein
MTASEDISGSLPLWDLDDKALNVVCATCGLGFDAIHVDDRPNSETYSCPMCGARGVLTGTDSAKVAAYREAGKS